MKIDKKKRWTSMTVDGNRTKIKACKVKKRSSLFFRHRKVLVGCRDGCVLWGGIKNWYLAVRLLQHVRPSVHSGETGECLPSRGKESGNGGGEADI